MKTIYFDMDGTIADLYDVPGWLASIKAEDISPFLIAKPLCDTWELSLILRRLQLKGYKIGVITWTPKNATPEYAYRVAAAKKHWLRENLLIRIDDLKILPYGTNKKSKADRTGILFDDEEYNRNTWGPDAYEPAEIMNILLDLE